MEHVLELLLLLIGFSLLILGSNLFVDSAVRIAKRFHVPEIGSIGTTLPEVMVSSTAAVGGHTQMALSTAIGSVICNTALIAGFVQFVRPCEIRRKDFFKSSGEFFSIAAIYCFFAWRLGKLTQVCGLVLLLLYALYSYRAVKYAQGSSEGQKKSPVASIPLDFIFLFFSAFVIFGGAQLLVNNGVKLAYFMHIPERVISLSLIALGTSLPELVTSITALIKRHTSLSVGNVIGANILNLLLVCGLPSTITPLFFTPSMLKIDIPVMLLVMSILTIPTLIRGKFSRIQGALLLGLYAGYMVYLF